MVARVLFSVACGLLVALVVHYLPHTFFAQANAHSSILFPSFCHTFPLSHNSTQAKAIKDKCHAFIRHCLLPRLKRSMADAVYCHYFCLKLHELNVPNWPAGFFWDEVRVRLLVTLCDVVWLALVPVLLLWWWPCNHPCLLTITHTAHCRPPFKTYTHRRRLP